MNLDKCSKKLIDYFDICSSSIKSWDHRCIWQARKDYEEIGV